MKLWEALEKSHKAWKQSWQPGTRPLDVTKREAISINEFSADDWEPYREPKAEPAKGSQMALNEAVLNRVNLLDEAISGIQADIRQLKAISEQQQAKIDRLEKAQIEHDKTLKEWYEDIQLLRLHLCTSDSLKFNKTSL